LREQRFQTTEHVTLKVGIEISVLDDQPAKVLRTVAVHIVVEPRAG
jgi:hypothetical protein